MIQMFDLIKPETMSTELFFGLIRQARQIALEIEGIYDLALYQKIEQLGVWRCSVDMVDQKAWGLLLDDPRFQQVVNEAKALGVKIVPEGPLKRRV